jgi:hypothetical protein
VESIIGMMVLFDARPDDDADCEQGSQRLRTIRTIIDKTNRDKRIPKMFVPMTA